MKISLPKDKRCRVLVISCGPDYLVDLLREVGYEDVLGIDSDPGKIAHARNRGLDCRTEEAFPFLEAHTGGKGTVGRARRAAFRRCRSDECLSLRLIQNACVVHQCHFVDLSENSDGDVPAVGQAPTVPRTPNSLDVGVNIDELLFSIL